MSPCAAHTQAAPLGPEASDGRPGCRVVLLFSASVFSAGTALTSARSPSRFPRLGSAPVRTFPAPIRHGRAVSSSRRPLSARSDLPGLKAAEEESPIPQKMTAVRRESASGSDGTARGGSRAQLHVSELRAPGGGPSWRAGGTAATPTSPPLTPRSLGPLPGGSGLALAPSSCSGRQPQGFLSNM